MFTQFYVGHEYHKQSCFIYDYFIDNENYIRVGK